MGLPLLKRQMPLVRHPPTIPLSIGFMLLPIDFPLPDGKLVGVAEL